MDFDYEQHVFKSPEFQSIVGEAVEFFSKTPVHNLPPPNQFLGPGVYGLYYVGDYEPYAEIARLNLANCIKPVYVGKAVPPGSRTARNLHSSSSDLYGRLREHTESIQFAMNLKASDFRCRFMVLNGIEQDLIVPVESELIRRHKPLWNTYISGFGIHHPGSGRYGQAPSEWDILHPGRPWVANLTGKSRSLDEIIAKVRTSLAQSLLP